MKKVTARAVCEGAIVAALTVLLMFMGIYVPVFRTLAMFVCGIPLAYLMIRQGVYIYLPLHLLRHCCLFLL